MKPRKTLELILNGSKNIRFEDFIRLVEAFGFKQARMAGSHHIFSRKGIPEAVNLQNFNGMAKPYQIKQFLKIIEQFGFTLEDKE